MTDRPLHILFIDDDEALVRLAAKELGRRGFTVTSATEAASALALLERQAFDVIVLDHFMPGSDGLETLAAIRARKDAPPVLYVTAAEDGRLAVAALKAGAADYVIKDLGEAFFDLLTTSLQQAVEQEILRREKEAADAAVREARDRAEWLLREVNHRCANSLALVGSLVSMQATHVRDATAKQALLETVNRINAVGQIHRRLYSTDDVRTVEMRSYLEGLAQELRSAIVSDGQNHAITLDADPVRVPTDRAISIGVIVSELITNAFKYAYAPGESGEIRVSLRQLGPDEVELTVSDDGIGWGDDAQPRGAGLGLRIITAMIDALKGVMNRDKSDKGASITMRFPITYQRTPQAEAAPNS